MKRTLIIGRVAICAFGFSAVRAANPNVPPDDKSAQEAHARPSA
jgi:hypothetical protein